MSNGQSASAVFPMVEFSKRFTPNVKDPLRECCEFLAKLKINPADAGVIKDSSGGIVWFTNEGIARLNSYIQASASGSIQDTKLIPSRKSSSNAYTRSTHKSNAYSKLTLERNAIKIQRAWRKYSAAKKQKKKQVLKVGKTARLDTQANNTLDYISNLSKIYQETIQSPNKEKDASFIRLLNSDDTFKASKGLANDSLSSSSSKSSTTFIYQKLSRNFIKWLNSVLDLKYQTSENVIDILKAGNVLCQLVVMWFPATACHLLNKGVEFSIHQIVFFLEFCRCSGITDVFKLSDLVPSLIQDESSSGITVLRTISSLESKAKTVANWNGPFFEFYGTLQEVYGTTLNGDPKDHLGTTDKKRSSDMGNLDSENSDLTQNQKKSPTESQMGSIKGRLARLREKRADRLLSMPNQTKVSGPENPESFPKTDSASPYRELSSHQPQSIKRDSSPPKREVSRNSDEYLVKPPEFGRNETKENVSSRANVQTSSKELSREAPKTSKLVSPFTKKSDIRDNAQSMGDSESVKSRKDTSSTDSGIRPSSISKDRDSLLSYDSNSSQLSPLPRSNSTSSQLITSTDLDDYFKVVWKIAAGERNFATVMAHLVEFLDILAKQKQIEIHRLSIPAEQIQDNEDSESYDTDMSLLINNERQEDESDVAYCKRLQNELEELSQSRDITLSVISVHKTLFKMMTEYLQEMKNQKTPDRAPLGKIFLTFAADMLTPYVRYSVFFFNNETASEDLRPSGREDFQKTVDFIKTYIKVEDVKRPHISREEWTFFMKFPLQRLHNYSEFLEEAIAKSNRGPSDIHNRKLRVAKLKILAAFDTIRERFE